VEQPAPAAAEEAPQTESTTTDEQTKETAADE
jgi:hypothetical protein